MKNLEFPIVVLTKYQWLHNRIFNWTQEEIDKADDKGFIGHKFGFDCYLVRFIPTI